MADLRTTHSCGVAELAHVCTGKWDEETVVNNLLVPGIEWVSRSYAPTAADLVARAQVFWIDVRYDEAKFRKTYPRKNGKIGVEMAKYIKKHKLGTVVAGRWTTNPQHPGRKIKTYVWSVSPSGYMKWLRSQPKFIEERERRKAAMVRRAW